MNKKGLMTPDRYHYYLVRNSITLAFSALAITGLALVFFSD